MSATLHEAAPFHFDRAWRLDTRVSLRPERFGALAYHFGTRRLSFLKSRELVALLTSLDGRRSAIDACRAAGIADEDLPRYGRALSALAASGMLVEGPQR